ncbi:MAG: ribosomal protein S18-alanine N-acetyltransferase [Synergistaceae bacterium]|jgi:ribosomal-protein-alanine N-acetyltransferase|nr:ribosomal protein S18-alanine N-acetyltransferase [Synergistaceae bacterium]
MQIADIDFCVPGDIDELYAIECACFPSPWKRYLLENDLSELGEVVYLKALLNGVIVGYGVLGRNETESYLQNLAVSPEHRRLGIASQLMLGFDGISAEWGCRRMRLEVRSSNTSARDFYARIGFIYQSRSRGYYSNGEDALILAARLPLKIK